MALTTEQYTALVQQLETYSKADAPGYRSRVAGLATLGYAYIIVILAVALALFIGVIVLATTQHVGGGGLVKILLILGLILWNVGTSLFIRIPPPEGIPLTRQAVPDLFKLLDGITTELGAPRFDHVVLVDDFNAGVVQVPKLGLLPWFTNYLILGLPLMSTLSPIQFKAVLAHEFGHLAGGHSKFNSTIYRLRLSWMQILEKMHRTGGATWLFEPFLKWYAPYFSAYSFVLARQDEYEADRASARVVPPEAIAGALLATHTRSRWLDETYWRGIAAGIKTSPRPDVAPFTGLATAGKTPMAGPEAARWIDAAVHELTGTSDTHPALQDRLGALGYFNLVTDAPFEAHPLLTPATESAADVYLGDKLPLLAQRLDEAWTDGVKATWAERHQAFAAALEQLRQLDLAAAQRELDAKSKFTRAQLHYNLHEADTALPLVQEALDAAPGNIEVRHLHAHVALELNDPAGVALMEGVIQASPAKALDGLQSLHRFYVETGQHDQAQLILNRAHKQAEVVMDAEEERAIFRVADKIEPHRMDADTVHELVAALRGYPEIKAAYLARKKVKHLAEEPCLVLGLTRDKAWYQLAKANEAERLADLVRTQVSFPAMTYVLVLEGDWAPLAGKMKKIPGALIYEAKPK